MDTASHFLIGLGLGGMAHLSPAVVESPSLGLAVTIGTVIASEAPDFDYVYRIKGNATYLKSHRGLTHSVPAWFVWPTLITLGMMPFFQGIPWSILWLWCFAAVMIHVALDALNTFGTQALLPFTAKRLSKDVLMILDPVIFTIQLVGIILWWGSVFAPGPLFAIINGLTVVYIVVRMLMHSRLQYKLQSNYQHMNVLNISVIPTFLFNQWAAVIETEEAFVLGKICGERFKEESRLKKSISFEADQTIFNRTGVIEPFWTELKRKSAIVDTFFYVATHIYSEKVRFDNTTRIILTDLRFRIGNLFPFKAVFDLDRDGNIVEEHLYWRGEKSSPQPDFSEKNRR